MKVKKQLVFLEYPEAGDKPYDFVLHSHHRGKSVHGDLRLAKNDHLEGWTLNYQIAGVIKEPVETMAEARRLLRANKYGKLDFETGELKQREIRGGIIRKLSVQSERKSPQPIAWLEFEGVAEKGTVGATREFKGVFLAVDRGKVGYGAKKPTFLEYFLDGELLKGRHFFRLLRLGRERVEEALQKIAEEFSVTDLEFLPDFKIRKMLQKQQVLPPSEEQPLSDVTETWLFIQPDDQLPNVLNERTVFEKPWIPPREFSALPGAVRERVPRELRYWEPQRENKRMELREELFELWKEEGVLAEISGSVEKRRFDPPFPRNVFENLEEVKIWLKH